MRSLPVVQADPSTHAGAVRPAAATAVRYRVEGMDCGACARTLERVVGALDGVDAAEVSFGAATLAVFGEVADGPVLAAVERAGFRARPLAQRRAAASGEFWRHDRRARSTLAAIALLAVAVALDLAGARRAVAEPAYLASMLVGGFAIGRAAIAALRRRSLDMHVLMSLAAIGAVSIGAYAEGAWVLVLFALGTTLETYALDRTRRSVEALAELAPAEARLVERGQERLVPVEDVATGATIGVRPGERLPLDGIVTGGASSIDESAVTGESVPVGKSAGDAVYAGTLNQLGALEVRDDEHGGRVDDQPHRRARRAGAGQPGPVRAARRPLRAGLHAARVRGCAGARGGSRLARRRRLDLALPQPGAADRRLPVLARDLDPGRGRLRDRRARRVAACSSRAARRSRTSPVSASPASTRRGRSPQGIARLRTIVPAAGLSADEALRLVAAVERHSEHPLGAALVQAARERGLVVGEPQRFLALPGRGVDALVDGRALWAGGPRLAGERLGAAGERRRGARGRRPDRDRARRAGPAARAVRPCRRDPSGRGERRPPALRRARHRAGRDADR